MPRRMGIYRLRASSCALGITMTASERSHGRLMRAPDHSGDGPAWFYGPSGASQVFQPGETIPAGWQDHPSKVVTPEETADVSNTLDAEGWPFDPEMHAATQTQTKDGLWRMKVGVSRPAPKESFPKPVLDL